MKRIVEFPLESGGSILVEVDEPSRTGDRIGLDNKMAQKAEKTFESALDTVKPLADAIMTKVRNLNQPADEVEVKFGVKITTKFGAVIASGNGEVNCEITLKWNRELHDGSNS